VDLNTNNDFNTGFMLNCCIFVFNFLNTGSVFKFKHRNASQFSECGTYRPNIKNLVNNVAHKLQIVHAKDEADSI
jgi:hypothetical protein